MCVSKKIGPADRRRPKRVPAISPAHYHDRADEFRKDLLRAREGKPKYRRWKAGTSGTKKGLFIPAPVPKPTHPRQTGDAKR